MSDETFADTAAVAFDGCGTLFDFGSVTRATAGALNGQEDTIAREWYRTRAELAHAAAGDGEEDRDYWHLTGVALDRVMAAHGLNDPVLRARLMQKMLAMDAWPDAHEALAAVKAAGKRAVVLSDLTSTMLAAGLKHAGLSQLMDVIVPTESADCLKPAPAAYETLAERLKTDPGRIGYVTAAEWDAQAAVQAGLHVIWLDRDNEGDGPSGIQARLQTLNGLSDLLGSR